MVHTPRHLFRLWQQLGHHNVQRRSMMLMALAFTVASWLAGGIALWMIPDAISVDAHLLRVIFIGLAALTVPHMLLVDGLFRRHKPATKVMADKMRITGTHFQLDSGQDNNPQGHNDA